MALLLLTLLAGFALAAGIVLADSGLRLWSAFGALGVQKAILTNNAIPAARSRPVARVITRVSYARTASTPLRAAA